MTATAQDGRSDGLIIGLVGFAHLLSHFYQIALGPLFPLLKAEFGVSYTALALLVTVFYGTSGVCQSFAGILVDLARTDTRPRSQALAGHLLGALEGEFGHLHTDSGRSAGFGVLKSPDIPSVLVELGFMSDARDLENLTSDDWRKAAAVAIRNGLIAWADADAVAAARRRN